MKSVATSIIGLTRGWMLVRHTPISQHKRAILCLHGLGDSSLAFLEALQSPELDNFNIVAPDLLGHGGSSAAPDDDYSFNAQINSLNAICENLRISKFIVVGHSLGADIATHLAKDAEEVCGLVNIEGNLTPPDVITSKQAVQAAETDDFDRWFKDDFMEKTVLNRWATKWPSCQRYYASLWFCRSEAFLSSAREVCKHNAQVPDRPESETGLIFQRLTIPKIYCWGDRISDETNNLLKDASIQDWPFENAFHWPMIDRAGEFYPLLRRFCSRE